MDDARIARRFAACTIAAAVALAVPAAVQAVLVLHPDAASAGDARAAMSLALAGTVVAVPGLLRALMLARGAARASVLRFAQRRRAP